MLICFFVKLIAIFALARSRPDSAERGVHGACAEGRGSGAPPASGGENPPSAVARNGLDRNYITY